MDGRMFDGLVETLILLGIIIGLVGAGCGACTYKYGSELLSKYEIRIEKKAEAK